MHNAAALVNRTLRFSQPRLFFVHSFKIQALTLCKTAACVTHATQKALVAKLFFTRLRLGIVSARPRDEPYDSVIGQTDVQPRNIVQSGVATSTLYHKKSPLGNFSSTLRRSV